MIGLKKNVKITESVVKGGMDDTERSQLLFDIVCMVISFNDGYLFVLSIP